MGESRPWHRLFALSLIDFFRDMPVTVDFEKDLSLKQQRLDVVIIRKGTDPLPCRLPDGFDYLAAHNLVSFKSYQEALDGWALNELVGHYVNYRKQASPSMQELLPEAEFRLFAVSVRFPQGLARQIALTPVQPGVYDTHHFTGPLRLVVIHELPQQEHNALLHLFSARMDLVQYGATHYRLRSEETSTLLTQLLKRYRLEVTLMPDALEQFAKETIEEIVNEMPLDQLLAVISRKTRAARAQRPKDDTPRDALAQFARETIEELFKELSVDELLAALSPETRTALAERLKEDSSSPKPQTKGPDANDPVS